MVWRQQSSNSSQSVPSCLNHFVLPGRRSMSFPLPDLNLLPAEELPDWFAIVRTAEEAIRFVISTSRPFSPPDRPVREGVLLAVTLSQAATPRARLLTAEDIDWARLPWTEYP